MDAKGMALNTISSGLSTLIAIGGEIALLVVVSTVVKRHRPDAYGKLMTWAIASLASTLAFTAVYFVVPLILSSLQTDSFLTVYAILNLIRGAVGLTLVLLLVRGLVAIAQPPKPPVVPSDAPYR